MKDEEIAAAEAAGGEVLHVPIALGAVVVTYNLEGVDKLRLDGPTLADIFEGKVTSWNDSRIAKLNPDAKLPSKDIAVVHRADESGTTFVFTGYLSAADAAWKSGPGQSKNPQWPTGTGAQGNDGVAAAVQQQDGAVGYTEIAYALQNKLSFASLKNRNGDWVTASLESTTKAGEGFEYPDDLRFSLLDSASAGAYPIVSATWQLVWKDPSKAGQDADKAAALQSWLKWELGDGQALAADLDYAPLPTDLLTKANDAVDSIKVG
jgi:phosphate transport system substrate-binding protein